MYETAWKLVTKWLRNLPRNPPVPYTFPHFPIHFLMFHLLFTQFLWVFPMFPFVFLPVSYFRSYEFLSRGLRVIIWNTFWYHAILPSNVLLIDINYHIWKQLDSENKIFRIHCGIDKFCITIRKLIKAIELQYYMNLKANFNLNKFENLSTRFDRQSIIRIQSFFLLVVGRFRSFLARCRALRVCCRSFQIVVGCFRWFPVVPHFSKYLFQFEPVTVDIIIHIPYRDNKPQL